MPSNLSRSMKRTSLKKPTVGELIGACIYALCANPASLKPEDRPMALTYMAIDFRDTKKSVPDEEKVRLQEWVEDMKARFPAPIASFAETVNRFCPD